MYRFRLDQMPPHFKKKKEERRKYKFRLPKKTNTNIQQLINMHEFYSCEPPFELENV